MDEQPCMGPWAVSCLMIYGWKNRFTARRLTYDPAPKIRGRMKANMQERTGRSALGIIPAPPVNAYQLQQVAQRSALARHLLMELKAER